MIQLILTAIENTALMWYNKQSSITLPVENATKRQKKEPIDETVELIKKSSGWGLEAFKCQWNSLDFGSFKRVTATFFLLCFKPNSLYVESITQCFGKKGHIKVIENESSAGLSSTYQRWHIIRSHGLFLNTLTSNFFIRRFVVWAMRFRIHVKYYEYNETMVLELCFLSLQKFLITRPLRSCTELTRNGMMSWASPRTTVVTHTTTELI